jgi:hypothetical protein
MAFGLARIALAQTRRRILGQREQPQTESPATAPVNSAFPAEHRDITADKPTAMRPAVLATRSTRICHTLSRVRRQRCHQRICVWMSLVAVLSSIWCIAIRLIRTSEISSVELLGSLADGMDSANT